MEFYERTVKKHKVTLTNNKNNQSERLPRNSCTGNREHEQLSAPHLIVQHRAEWEMEEKSNQSGTQFIKRSVKPGHFTLSFCLFFFSLRDTYWNGKRKCQSICFTATEIQKMYINIQFYFFFMFDDFEQTKRNETNENEWTEK